MKILVTGGAGYIGGTVTQLLLDRGHAVVVYDNLCHAQRSMVPAGATFVEGDVADSKRLDELFADASFAGVMHFAALIEAGESMRRPEVYFRNNTAATLSLLEAMVRNNLPKICFFFDCGGLWGTGEHADSRGCRPRSHQCLRRIEAAGGADAFLDSPHPRTALCQPALLQRRGCDSRPRRSS